MQHRVGVGLAGPVVAVALLTTGCTLDLDRDEPAPAAGGRAAPSSIVSAAPPEISIDEAQDLALQAVGGGRVLGAEIEDEDDVVRVWEVALLTSAGERRTVSVDATNGSILGNVQDD